MDVVPTPPGAPEDSSAGDNALVGDAAVFQALVRGLSQADAQFVAEAMQRARQATRDADARGESSSQPVW